MSMNIGARIQDVLDDYAKELCDTLEEVSTDEERESISAKIDAVQALISEVSVLDIYGIPDPETQIALIWSAADVKSIRPDLTDEQAMDVLKVVRAHHDCTVGVSWDTLDYEADEKFPLADIKDPFLRLVAYSGAGREVELERRINGGRGIRLRSVHDDVILYSSLSDEQSHHVGHDITIARYGNDEIVEVSIECEDCCEVIASFPRPETGDGGND